MSEALYGTITLVVGARTYTLRPTLEAALLIEARFGGLRGALESMRLMSISSSADIIVVRRTVWQYLMSPLSRFGQGALRDAR